MKKFLAIIPAAAMLLSLAACGNEDNLTNSTTSNSASTPSNSAPTPSTTPSNNENESKEPTVESDSSIVPSVGKATEGTLELSTANFTITINDTAVPVPYYLNELIDAGLLPNEALEDIELGSGDYFSPNIYIDQDENYLVTPAYYNGADSSVSIAEARANEITMFTYAETPEDQNVSILGIKFGMTKTEVKNILGEPMLDEGDGMQWLVSVSDNSALEGNFFVSFTSDSDDAVVCMVDLSLLDLTDYIN